MIGREAGGSREIGPVHLLEGAHLREPSRGETKARQPPLRFPSRLEWKVVRAHRRPFGIAPPTQTKESAERPCPPKVPMPRILVCSGGKSSEVSREAMPPAWPHRAARRPSKGLPWCEITSRG